MVEKNVKKLKAKKRRVMNGFNTGTRDMKLKTAYRRKKRWSADDADHSFVLFYESVIIMFKPRQEDTSEYLDLPCRG